ncbi:DUF3530 family protein, partial [Beggiatoa alba]|nr:DUF3530 family protein [Beggiatoa alba]
MIKYKYFNYLFLLINFGILSFSPISHASDLAKEKRWADQIVDSLMSGDAVWLEDGKNKFLGLYTEASSTKTHGAIIVVHGIGVHPNWPDVILPIRTELPEQGWATLSIQMPILENEKTTKDYLPLFEEVGPRFTAAIDFLKTKNIQNIVIAAHSLGTSMTNNYLATQPDPAIRAYIAVSMPNDPGELKLNTVKQLSKITTIPVLDIFGSQDLESVMRFSKNRLLAGKKGNPKYKQVIIKGADHFY